MTSLNAENIAFIYRLFFFNAKMATAVSEPVKSEEIIHEGENETEEEEREPEIPLYKVFSFEEAVQLINTKNKSTEVLGQPQNLKLLSNMVDDTGNTLLHYAASAGKLDLCMMMIKDGGSKVGIRNRKGENAAHMSMANNHTECSIALLAVLGEDRKESPWLF